MIVTSCPHCGMEAQVPEGISPYLCGFCRRSFDVGRPHAVIVRPVRYTSGYSMYWTIRLAAVALLALLSGAGWVYHRMTGKHIAALEHLDDDGPDTWDGTTALTCDGNDQINVSGVTATFPTGAALSAGGNCQVTCTGCTLKAPFAVQTNGNAKVVIVGGALEGEVAIAATGNATVDVRGDAKVSGTISRSGNAKVTGVALPAPSSTPGTHVASAPPAAPAKPGKKK